MGGVGRRDVEWVGDIAHVAPGGARVCPARVCCCCVRRRARHRTVSGGGGVRPGSPAPARCETQGAARRWSLVVAAPAPAVP